MKCVIDSNVLFTFFWKHSVFNDIIHHRHLLLAPEYALLEIKKYESDIRQKTQMTSTDFQQRTQALTKYVIFVPLEAYQEYFKEIVSWTSSYTQKERDELLRDIDFYALALSEQCPIWTNDALFKKQKNIPVLTTKEIIELLKFK